MYESTEAIIRLRSDEVQQAWGIWLDSDGEQAIRFITEKIVHKTLGVACNRSAGQIRKCNCVCCRQHTMSL